MTAPETGSTSVEEPQETLVHAGKARGGRDSSSTDPISFSKPEDRLLAGQIDEVRTADLRAEALKFRSDMQKSAVRGFVGGRVDLLPHQMFIANEVSSRVTPRVLLADEVGLGKTIEAGLILHRLHLTGRANRVLILLPDALVNQWFVELLRRFNLVASVIDEERCEDLESDDPEGNPFLSCQIALSSINYIAGDEERTEQCVTAGWDLLIVDEAHHLEWSPESASAAYELVETLARKPRAFSFSPPHLSNSVRRGTSRGCGCSTRSATTAWRNFRRKRALRGKRVAVDRLLSGEALTASDQSLFARNPSACDTTEALATGGEEAVSELVMSCCWTSSAQVASCSATRERH